MSRLISEFDTALAQRAADGLYRARCVVASRDGALYRVDCRDVLHFGSNDHLGLAQGARDTVAPAAALAWLARSLPAGGHAPIGAAAHAPFLSHQDEFFATFDDFADGR